jgi:hypothetical protein
MDSMDEKVPEGDLSVIEDSKLIRLEEAESVKADGDFRDNEVGEMPSPIDGSPSKASESSSFRPVTPRKRTPFGRQSSALIDINSLPPDVAETLRQYDINGDGQISVTEMVHGAMTQAKQEEKVG